MLNNSSANPSYMHHISEKIVLEKSHENEEMYLKAIYLLDEEGIKPIHASEVAKLLKISLPSTTEMLNKLASKGLLSYSGRDGVSLKVSGRKIAEKIVRNLRLTEVLFRDVLHIDYESESACRLEHAIDNAVADALRKFLKNPQKCPHGKIIPY